jgi:hypothetical protein
MGHQLVKDKAYIGGDELAVVRDIDFCLVLSTALVVRWMLWIRYGNLYV